MRLYIPKELERKAAAHRDLACRPGIAARVVQALGEPGWTLEEIESSVNLDPVLVGHLSGRATAMTGRGENQTVGVAEALSRIGPGALKGVLLGICNPSLFREPSEVEDRLWEHSLAAGIACRGIAPRVAGISEDQAYAVGLLHNLGKVLLCIAEPEAYLEVVRRGADQGLPAERVEERAFGYNHAQAGAALALKWGLADATVRALFFHRDLEACEALRPAERRVCLLAALGGRVADALGTGVASKEESISWETEPAAVGLGLGPADMEPLVLRAGERFAMDRALV